MTNSFITATKTNSNSNNNSNSIPPSSPSSPSSDEIQLSWESDIATKIRCQVEMASSSSKNTTRSPYMLCVVGIPGCGKTTSCHILSSMLSDLGCMVVPFDGYHFPLSKLRAMDEAATAAQGPDDETQTFVYRRGAPDTFDVQRLYHDLEWIRYGGSGSSSNDVEKILCLPGFDHARGDPDEGVHEFDRTKHKIILCEGLYLLHDDDNDDPLWKDVKRLFDYSIFVNSNVDACIERLKVRNKCIPGYTEEEIEIRCEDVDRVNALIVERSKRRADLVVESVLAK